MASRETTGWSIFGVVGAMQMHEFHSFGLTKISLNHSSYVYKEKSNKLLNKSQAKPGLFVQAHVFKIKTFLFLASNYLLGAQL